MSTVELLLPADVLAELDLPQEGARGGNELSVAIDTMNVAASIVTLAALRHSVTAVAAAIRRWRLRQPPSTPCRLHVKGRGIDLKIDLPPNVQTAQVIEAIQDLIQKGEATQS
jgi:hypothetical protein